MVQGLNHFINIWLYLQIPSDVSQIFSDDACSNIIESVSMQLNVCPLLIYKFFNKIKSFCWKNLIKIVSSVFWDLSATAEIIIKWMEWHIRSEEDNDVLSLGLKLVVN